MILKIVLLDVKDSDELTRLMNDKYFLLLFQCQIFEHEEIEVNENHLVTKNKTNKKTD